jgi:phosphoglucosamine mutase
MQARGQTLSQLVKCWTRYPQLTTNIKVREKKPFDQIEGLTDLLREAEAEMESNGGRVLLRYSGTEPKARLLMEGRERAALEQWSRKIADTIKRHVGA